jgi:hypothetical protein
LFHFSVVLADVYSTLLWIGVALVVVFLVPGKASTQGQAGRVSEHRADPQK